MVTGVVLAAGAGRRLGGVAKAALLVGGRPLVHLVVEAFERGGVTDVVVVTGAHVARVGAVLDGCAAVRRVHNPDWERGQASSVAVAVRAALANAWGDLLISPVDVPDLSPAVVARMAAVGGTAQPVVGGVPTHPARIAHADLPALLAALEVGPADRGAGPWLRGAARRVDVGDLTDLPRDVDTPADLARVTGAGITGTGHA